MFDVVAAPYLGRRTRAMAEKIDVLHRGTDFVLAAHRTRINRRLTAVTVETVAFHRPGRVEFRLVRGPVPAVTETFRITGDGHGTRLDYEGTLTSDLWAAGAWWGRVVARRWEETVRGSLAAVKTEAERLG